MTGKEAQQGAASSGVQVRAGQVNGAAQAQCVPACLPAAAAAACAGVTVGQCSLVTSSRRQRGAARLAARAGRCC